MAVTLNDQGTLKQASGDPISTLGFQISGIDFVVDDFVLHYKSGAPYTSYQFQAPVPINNYKLFIYIAWPVMPDENNNENGPVINAFDPKANTGVNQSYRSKYFPGIDYEDIEASMLVQQPYELKNGNMLMSYFCLDLTSTNLYLCGRVDCSYADYHISIIGIR